MSRDRSAAPGWPVCCTLHIALVEKLLRDCRNARTARIDGAGGTDLPRRIAMKKSLDKIREGCYTINAMRGEKCPVRGISAVQTTLTDIGFSSEAVGFEQCGGPR